MVKLKRKGADIMKKIYTTGRIAALILVFTTMLGTITVFATDPSISAEDEVFINEEELEITKTESMDYFEFSDNLAKEIKDCSNGDYDSLVEDYFDSNTNPIYEKVEQVVEANANEEGLYLDVDDDFYEEYETTYDVDNETTLVVTPTYLVIETFSQDADSIISNLSTESSTVGASLNPINLLSTLSINEKPSYTIDFLATTKSVSGTATKTYYSWIGLKMFTLSVTCTFNYNGSKAWYKSGFDYYYSRGSFSTWQVSNWRGWKEASGTNFRAYCSGNFHYGFEYQGVGLVIQDIYCKNTISCNKSGTISKSYSAV